MPFMSDQKLRALADKIVPRLLRLGSNVVDHAEVEAARDSLLSAATPEQVILGIDRLAAAIRSSSHSAPICFMALAVRIEHDVWVDTPAALQRASAAIVSDSRSASPLNWSCELELASALFARSEARTADATRSLRKLVAMDHEYYHHVGHCYLGLQALEAGDVEEAVRRLGAAGSVVMTANGLLRLKLYDPILLDALVRVGANGPEVEAYSRLPLGPRRCAGQ